MKHEIQLWLEGGKNYQEGKALYSKYGKHKSLLATLKAMGDNRNCEKMLEERLRKILSDSKLRGLNTDGLLIEMPHIGKATRKQTFHVDDTLAKLQLEANAIYAQMGKVHARLLAVKTDEERAELRTELIDKLQAEWCIKVYQRDYYMKHGQFPPDEKPAKKETQSNTLDSNNHARLMLLRSKVSRAINEQLPSYKKKLDKNANDKKTAKKLEAREKELELWKAEIVELEKGRGNG